MVPVDGCHPHKIVSLFRLKFSAGRSRQVGHHAWRHLPGTGTVPDT